MTRLLSGVALGAAALAAILLLPPLGLRLLACLLAALAAREYIGVLHQNGRPPHVAPLLLLVVVTCWWVSEAARGDLLALLLLGLGWLAVEVLFLGLTVDPEVSTFVGDVAGFALISIGVARKLIGKYRTA